MNVLIEKHCTPCEGGIAPMSVENAEKELANLDNWTMNDEATEISKEYEFKDFYRTMAFVNAIAYMANKENHHPDLAIGYNYCHIRYSTHAIDGLSINDFICAAKIDVIANM